MKRIVEKVLANSINSIVDAKQKLSQNNINTIPINENFFNEDYCEKTDITKCAIVKIGDLKTIKSPVLYWFEFNHKPGGNLNIRDTYTSYRAKVKANHDSPFYRNTSAIKTKYSNVSKTLYVGKVEKYFWGRLVTHLGYNKTVKTAGLQLFHWYKIKDFGELKLKYIVFDDSMKYIITALEKELSLELEPLIGKY